MRLSIFGARPDFLVVFLGCASLFLNRGPGALLGFGCGAFHGAIAGANLAHYAVSRTLGGFLASWSRTIGFELNILVAVATTAVTTLIVGIVWMFLAAPHGVARFLGDTIGSAVYNGVLAIPTYLLLRRAVNSRSRSGI